MRVVRCRPDMRIEKSAVRHLRDCDKIHAKGAKGVEIAQVRDPEADLQPDRQLAVVFSQSWIMSSS